MSTYVRTDNNKGNCADRPKVLCVLGTSRCGSTVIDRTIGKLPNFFSCGELAQVWQRGVLEDQYCSCGKRFSECEFWKHFAGRVSNDTAEQCAQYHQQVIQGNCFIKLRRTLNTAEGRQYLEKMTELYEYISKRSRAAMLIDSSKNPFYAYMLNQMPGFDCYVLHVVRDPRGVAYSRCKSKWDPASQKYLPQKSLSYSAVVWVSRNLLIEGMFRWRRPIPYRFLKYEDFVRQPQHESEQIMQWMDNNRRNSFHNCFSQTSKDDNEHQVAGNPARFDGHTEIRLDEKWRSELGHGQQVWTEFLTLPLLLKYGYKLGRR